VGAFQSAPTVAGLLAAVVADESAHKGQAEQDPDGQARVVEFHERISSVSRSE